MNANSSSTNKSDSLRVRLLFVLIMLGFVMIPIITLILLRPSPEAGGFDALEALRSQERLLIRQQVEKEANVELGIEYGNEYSWIDKSIGVVRIPIDKAIEKTVMQLSTKPITQSDYVDVVTAKALGITPHPSVLPNEASESDSLQTPSASAFSLDLLGNSASQTNGPQTQNNVKQ